MLGPDLRAQLAVHLQHLRTPVELVADLDDGAASHRTWELLSEIAEVSPLVSAVRGVPDPDARIPSFLVTRPGEDVGVRFAGLPLGHELASLVLALLHVGGHPPQEDADLLARARALEGPLHFETYFSLTCQNCPDVVQALNTLSALHPQVSHTAIEGGAFAAEIEERGVLSVPAVFLDGEPFGQGRMGLAEIVARLDPASGEQEAAELATRAAYDVLVVGGGPAGVTAAMYAARKGIRTALLAERMGGQVLDTAGIENFPSVVRTEGTHLGAALESHVREHDVDVVVAHRATSVRPPEQPGAPIAVELSNGATLASRTVVIATGARWRRLGVPGEEEYLNRGVTFCPHCDGPLFRGKRVAVVGGGNSGVEAAIDLAGLAAHVTLLEYDRALRADAVLQRTLRGLSTVDVVTSAETEEVLGDGHRVTGLRYASRDDGSIHDVPVDGVFVQIGLLPATDWLSGVVGLNERGEVVVDDRGRTDVAGVFAAGDCTAAPYKQIVTSAGDGATAALSAFDHLIRSPEGARAG
ncbi:alkyl hydroperoxide reductase subunit F [Nocardioides soli]|uniref:Alkyl hydroperoxide reductase subunit F n=1 Tax=Nocardioides soli TaxID=1036020 RepID=A0A7W4VWP9_9ACTN|nr:alkyl hydroperoxide reductase subunit F [Nocardioides soli]MBB3043050.1 alkyl hydroperoxide reductase subunit F [Nocardioides soli]